MRAFTNRRYGDASVLTLETLPRPTPAKGEVLVRNRATALNGADWQLLQGRMLAVRMYWGLFKPRRPVLGVAVSGIVEEVGPGVTDFAVGDAVFGPVLQGGGFGELCAAPANKLLPKPAALEHAQAAALPVAAVTALVALRETEVETRERVLINGASGGVGSFAVQLAKRAGATVTAVAGRGKGEYLRGLGVDEVIDYTERDFTSEAGRYDLFVDFVGNRSIGACKRVLTPTGTYLAMAGPLHRTLRAALFGGRQARMLIAGDEPKDLQAVADLAAGGELQVPITQRFAFEDLPRAMAEMVAGHPAGRLVIDFPS